MAVALSAVEVEYGPREPGDGVLYELRHHRPRGAVVRGVIERCDPAFEDEPAALARFEIIGISVIRPGKLRDPRLAAPDEAPAVVHRRGVDMVILAVDAAERKVVLDGVLDLRVQDERPPGKVAVHRDLEDVVQVSARIEPPEVPEVVGGLVEEIKPVLALDPSDANLDVEVLSVDVRPVAVLGVVQKVGAVRVLGGDHAPVARVAVNAGDLVARELEYFEFLVRARKRERACSFGQKEDERAKGDQSECSNHGDLLSRE